MRWGLGTCLVGLMGLVLLGCSGGSLTMQDVDATFARLSEQTATLQGWDETSLTGTAITEDFVMENEGAPEPGTDDYPGYVAWMLPTLPGLLDVAQDDENASVEIHGDTLVIEGDRNSMRVEFEQSGDVFLIRRVTD